MQQMGRRLTKTVMSHQKDVDTHWFGNALFKFHITAKISFITVKGWRKKTLEAVHNLTIR